ncbi:hypothetical protein [Enhygromyxa salina]|uniref:hypothetical protein n=1 Tax=Enhygromyxa salina TaxID=215803 RepID=UPI0011B29555|nr:hypothetical protein [Enhygromyxa salina]
MTTPVGLDVRVAGDHFSVWTRDPARPLAIGPASALHIRVDDPGDNGCVDAMLALHENSQAFKRLAEPNLARLRRAKVIVENG